MADQLTRTTKMIQHHKMVELFNKRTSRCIQKYSTAFNRRLPSNDNIRYLHINERKEKEQDKDKGKKEK